MFNPENEVTDFELSKKLKEAGYPQEGGGWYWELPSMKLRFMKSEDANLMIAIEMNGIDYPIRIIKAPTIAEMLEWLPCWFDLSRDTCHNPETLGIYRCVGENWKYAERDKWGTSHQWFYDNRNMANAVGKALLWLDKNKYINFRKEVNYDKEEAK